jgi:hypothetical protein
MPNLSDSKPVWFRIYLMPTYLILAYLIPNLPDFQAGWFPTYLLPNLSDSEPFFSKHI